MFPKLLWKRESPGWPVKYTDYQASPMEILRSWNMLVSKQHSWLSLIYRKVWVCAQRVWQDRSQQGCLHGPGGKCWLHRGGDSSRGGMGPGCVPTPRKTTLMSKAWKRGQALTSLGCWEHVDTVGAQQIQREMEKGRIGEKVGGQIMKILEGLIYLISTLVCIFNFN